MHLVCTLLMLHHDLGQGIKFIRLHFLIHQNFRIIMLIVAGATVSETPQPLRDTANGLFLQWSICGFSPLQVAEISRKPMICTVEYHGGGVKSSPIVGSSRLVPHVIRCRPQEIEAASRPSLFRGVRQFVWNHLESVSCHFAEQLQPQSTNAQQSCHTTVFKKKHLN